LLSFAIHGRNKPCVTQLPRIQIEVLGA
jgi:hypothetical protein